jgi:hypothetical protein
MQNSTRETGSTLPVAAVGNNRIGKLQFNARVWDGLPKPDADLIELRLKRAQLLDAED